MVRVAKHVHLKRHCAMWLLTLSLVGVASCHGPASDPALPPRTSESALTTRHPDYGNAQVPPDLRLLVDRIVATGDHGQRPFAVVDKPGALIYVFDAFGKLAGSASILLGQAIGDDSEPGVGSKAIADIPPEERTTPAGRFVTMPGRNADGRPVVWIDYHDGISMHVVITDTPSEHRLERLASPDPARHRISWGCINLPAAFFAGVIQPAFAERGGIVYVLPERRTLADVFSTIGFAGSGGNASVLADSVVAGR